ncbi:hypothetical protein [Rhodoferax sp. GW822-FHT02A01]|uniref:hypothetical protein n=1 Tax=Rhodoferax sp. GW822-FHT02A01 TaxID=3141537 RepID=UPI00315CF0FF
MNNQHENASTDDVEVLPTLKVNQGRRRLGTAGTAVLLTLPGRSAVAGWGTCTGSELASGNLSRTGTVNPCGCSPGFWWNNNGVALWTSSPTLYINYPRTAKFNDVFGVPFYTDSNVKLQDVGPSTKNPNKFGAADNTGMHAVAALLNAQFYGARYPVLGMQTAAAVISAFKAACVDKNSLAAFVSRVDIYGKTADLWCNGSPES